MAAEFVPTLPSFDTLASDNPFIKVMPGEMYQVDYFIPFDHEGGLKNPYRLALFPSRTINAKAAN